MKKLHSLLGIVLLLTLLNLPVQAQEESTPEAVEVVPVEVVTVAPVEDAAPAVFVAPAADGVQVNLITVIIGLLTAFSAGGIMGIAGLAVFVERINKNTSTVTALELLGNSWPPETRELILGLARGTKSIGALGEEIFDNVPIAEKPVPTAAQ